MSGQFRTMRVNELPALLCRSCGGNRDDGCLNDHELMRMYPLYPPRARCITEERIKSRRGKEDTMDPKTQSDHMEDIRPNDAGAVLDSEPDTELTLDDESTAAEEAPAEG